MKRKNCSIIWIDAACIVWEDVSKNQGLHSLIVVSGSGIEHIAKTRLSHAELKPYFAYSRRGKQPQPLIIKQVATFKCHRTLAGNLIIESAFPTKRIKGNYAQRTYHIWQYEAAKATTPALYKEESKS